MTVNFELLYYELEQGGLPVEAVDINGKIDYTRELTAQEQTAADSIIAAHDPDGKLPSEVNREDARARFLLSQLANKTPQQIFTLMQGRMDSWTSLADARADLREWLPLFGAVIAWKVVDQ